MTEMKTMQTKTILKYYLYKKSIPHDYKYISMLIVKLTKQ